MTLRAAHHLGADAGPRLRRLVDDLRDVGIDIEVTDGIDPDGADLLFACGLFTRELLEADPRRAIVAAPIPEGEDAAVYRSVLVARGDDPASTLEELTRRGLAVNEYGSWSGWHALRHHLATRGLAVNATRIVTGAHRDSLEAVATGAADLAAIDSSIWHHGRDDPVRSRLQVVDRTDDWPAPPLSFGPFVDDATRHRITDLLRARADVAPATETDYDPMLAISRNED